MDGSHAPINQQGTGGNDDMFITSPLGIALNGGAGDDRIEIGGSLNLVNAINGGDGSDQIFGSSGTNLINGGAGNDLAEGGGGIDTLSGGEGNDTLSYEHATVTRGSTGVTVTLDANGGAIGAMSSGSTNAGVDLITGGFENIVGSGYDDMLTGNAKDNTLIGLGGDDTLNGGLGDDRIYGGTGADTINGGDYHDYIVGDQGDDILNGGPGADTLSYESATGTSGITITLNASGGAIVNPRGTDAGTDLITGGFENIVGTNYSDVFAGVDDDILTGNGDPNTLIGLAGDDVLNGEGGPDRLIGGAGADKLNGGAGLDIADYSTSPGGVDVNLTAPLGIGSDASGDRWSGIEDITGSNFDDKLTGDNGGNILRGGGGTDFVTGNGGNDIFIGGAGVDRLEGGAGNDIYRYENWQNSSDWAGYDDVLVAVFNGANGNGFDKLDLSQIDANSQIDGDQAFTFLGSAPFTGVAGQLRLQVDHFRRIVGDINGDGQRDFTITFFSGNPNATDIIL